MKLLVTGGAGFIGSNFIRYWLDKYTDDKIINLDLLTYAGNLDNTKSFSKNTNYKFVQGDICDEILVERLVKDVDTIVHFAAESHVDRSIDDPNVFLKTNVLGTGVLLRAAVKYKVKKFHHISTDEVFGSLDLNSKTKFKENSLYEPRSPYSASKAASDHLVRSFFYTYGLPITITNCSNNYGPYQGIEKFIPRAITDTLQGHKIKIYGDGKYIRDWLYVDDHCSAIESVINNGVTGATYLVGGQEEMLSNLQIANKILKLLNKSDDMIEFVNDRPGHDRKYSVDWSKINKALGWAPKETFEKRLGETVKWYMENEDYWKPQIKEVEKFYAKIKR